MFLFFGLVAVAGTAYLQAGRLEPLFLVGGHPGRRADDGHPRRQQPARHPDRHAGRQADAGGHPRPAGDGRASTRLLLARIVVVPVVLAAAGCGIAVLLPLATLAAGSPVAARPCPGFSEPRQLNLVLKGDRAAGARLQPAVRDRAGDRRRGRMIAIRSAHRGPRPHPVPAAVPDRDRDVGRARRLDHPARRRRRPGRARRGGPRRRRPARSPTRS